MGRLSTHVLDTARGKPAQGVAIQLARIDAAGVRTPVASALTNADGRTDAPLLTGAALDVGTYELTFAIGARNVESCTPNSTPTPPAPPRWRKRGSLSLTSLRFDPPRSGPMNQNTPTILRRRNECL